ncbi:carboxymuconolactone decarboxylase family protein [Lichenihabitans sp. Uapishka_5]|uniref:carboxymuconolactone decarboxylase family protein n=1 Tax=Lichenihabitans sp. Uapishka_5 TaxID=3037302 RepID=UPI0029E7E3C9|nr:carboxymuconolactone decarboxylase family protein [Lichenihabitans sp. Uapishka_5]MDX7954015.1 carboxymuconolactone decarboxylase family protein [Lichenihabitans sp. Uapishka_5]
MSHYPVHTMATAPEASQPSLHALQSAFGFIPNIAGAMATSPVLSSSLVGLFGNVHGGSFTEPQIQVLLLTNAVTNEAEWAVAFHTTLALQQGLTPADVDAIRSARLPNDPAFAALSRLARTLIEKRGRLDVTDSAAFLQAGFTEEDLLEVIAVTAASTITNYTANVTKPPLEPAFRDHAWHPA